MNRSPVSSNLSQITIVCLSFERQIYLSRSIKFWRHFSVKSHFIDGSSAPLGQDCRLDLGCFQNYVHMPIPYFERMEYALSQVSTPYILVVSDDEFFLPSAISSCISFLDNCSSYISAGMRVVNMVPYGCNFFFTEHYPGYLGKDFFHDDPLLRLNAHFRQYENCHWYAVNRVENFKRAMQIASSSISVSLTLQELVFEICMLLQGKSRILNELGWLRSREIPFTIDPYIHSPDRVAKGELADLIIENLGCFASAISRNDILDLFELPNSQAFHSSLSSSAAPPLTLGRLNIKNRLVDLMDFIKRPDLCDRVTHREFVKLHYQGVTFNPAELELSLATAKSTLN